MTTCTNCNGSGKVQHGWNCARCFGTGDQAQRVYAGIGSRETPQPILDKMTLIGTMLGARGFALRSGGAKGADTVFETGCDLVNGRKVIRVGTGWQPALDHAARYHPNWQACDEQARMLHARNSLVMVGDWFDQPVEFVVCWTPNAAVTGGTGQALRIASALNIPVFNLAVDGAEFAMWEFLK